VVPRPFRVGGGGGGVGGGGGGESLVGERSIRGKQRCVRGKTWIWSFYLSSPNKWRGTGWASRKMNRGRLLAAAQGGIHEPVKSRGDKYDLITSAQK